MQHLASFGVCSGSEKCNHLGFGTWTRVALKAPQTETLDCITYNICVVLLAAGLCNKQPAVAVPVQGFVTCCFLCKHANVFDRHSPSWMTLPLLFLGYTTPLELFCLLECLWAIESEHAWVSEGWAAPPRPAWWQNLACQSSISCIQAQGMWKGSLISVHWSVGA